LVDNETVQSPVSLLTRDMYDLIDSNNAFIF